MKNRKGHETDNKDGWWLAHVLLLPKMEPRGEGQATLRLVTGNPSTDHNRTSQQPRPLVILTDKYDAGTERLLTRVEKHLAFRPYCRQRHVTCDVVTAVLDDDLLAVGR